MTEQQIKAILTRGSLPRAHELADLTDPTGTGDPLVGGFGEAMRAQAQIEATIALAEEIRDLRAALVSALAASTRQIAQGLTALGDTISTAANFRP